MSKTKTITVINFPMFNHNTMLLSKLFICGKLTGGRESPGIGADLPDKLEKYICFKKKKN